MLSANAPQPTSNQRATNEQPTSNQGSSANKGNSVRISAPTAWRTEGLDPDPFNTGDTSPQVRIAERGEIGATAPISHKSRNLTDFGMIND